MTASLMNNASLRLALMGTTAAVALAMAPHAAQAQTAYDITFSGNGVSGAAVVTTNGTGSGGNVADAIAGTVTDTNTDNTTDAITGLSNYRLPDQNIQATATYVDNRGLAFATTASHDNNYILGYLSSQYVIGHSVNGADEVYFGSSMTAAVHASIDTAQASYDETSAPLTQSTVVFEGGTFKPTATTVLAAPLIVSGYNGGGTIDSSNGYVYFQGAITGPGGLTIAGAANGVEFNAVNTYTGGTTVDAGAILAVTVQGALPGNVTDNGYIQFLPSGSMSYGGVISGTGSVQAANPGGTTLTLTGNNTTNGTLFVSAGVQLGNGGTTGGWAGNIGDGGSVVFNRSNSSTFGGIIEDYLSSGAVTVQSGSLTLTGVNTYTGATTVSSGATLALSGAGSIASSGDPLVNGTFDISGTTSGASVVSLSGSGTVTLGGKTLTLTGATDTFSGAINNAGGAVNALGGGLTVAGGTETLTGASLYNGATSISAGATLALSGTGSIANTSGVTANGTFDVSQSTSPSVSIKDLSGSGSVALGGRSLVLANAAGTFTGVIADGGLGGGTGGALTITSGTETLTGANTYTGSTQIDSGATLNLGNGGASGTVAGAIADNGMLKFNYSGTVTVGSHISGTGSVEVVAGTVVETASSTVDGTVTIDSGATLKWGNGFFPVFLVGQAGVIDNGALVMDFGAANNLNVGPIGGSGSVTIHSGTDTNFASDTYTGATTVDSGALLAMSSSGSIASSSGVTANGTFDISQTDAGNAITSLSGSGSVDLGGRNLTLTNASGSFSGVIADGGVGGGTGGGLEIAGGTETLTNDNTYTGVTTIDAGATLAISSPGSVNASSGVVANGTFDLTPLGGSSAFINSLSGSGSVNLGLTTSLLLNNASGTFSGVISGGGGDFVVGGGSETLSGVNTFTGQTGISTGATLSLSGDGSIAASQLVIANGTFDVSGANAGVSIQDLEGLAAGSVVLGANTLTITNANSTFAGAISGSGGLTISGGTETLTGTNTFSGLTTVDAGATLALSGAGSIAASGDPLVNGTFDISQTTSGASVVSLSGSGSVLLGSKTLTLTGATDTFTGVIADGGLGGGTGGALTIAGGTETLAGDNTYTGGTTINAGATLQLGNGGAGGSVAGDIADNGLVQFNHSGASTFSGGLSGAGSAEIVAGTEVVTGSSSIGGTVTIDNGATLAWGDGTASAYLVGGGNAVVDNGTLVIDYGASSSSLFVPISGSGGVTIHSGRLINSAVSTYTGSTIIDPNSIFGLTGAGSIAQSSGVTANGYFDISGATAGVSIVSLSGSGGVGLGANTLTLTNASGTFSGAIDDSGGAGGGLAVTGGTETLTGTNTYTGATTVGAGATLALSGSGVIDSSSGVTVNGTFDISQSVEPAFINTLSGSGAVALGGQTLVLLNASGTFSGVIADGGVGGGTGGGFEVGHGTETLTGVNTFTGLAVTDGGATLALSGSGSIANTVGVSDYGTFDISGTTAGASVGSLSGTGAVALGGQTLTLTNANDTFFGVIADGGIAGGTGGGLTVAGGIETLTGVNTYTGLTTVDAGATLALQDGGSIAASGDPLVNGTFDISQTTSGASIISLSGSGSVLLGSKALTLTGAVDTFSGVIADGGLGGGTGGSLTISGGTETLTGANTYTGGTTVDGGAALVVGDGATSGSIVGDVVANGNFYFNRGDTITFAGLISGSGAIIQNGGGTTILTADETFTGGTYIYGGTLQLGNGGATGSLASSPFVYDSSLLVFDHSNAITYAGVIEDGFNPGSVTQAGSGALTLTGDNTFTGTLTIDAGTQVNLGAGGTTGSVVGPIEDDGLLTFNHSNAITYGGAIAGSGAVTQAGSGTVTLTGTNTYTGLTTINAGTALQLGAATATGTVAGDILDNGALTVDLDNTWVYGGAISGSGSLTQAGSWNFGSLILTGASTYTGGTTINSTTSLVLGNNTATGSIVGDVLDNGQLVFDRSNAYTFAGVISGAGAVYSVAPGVITLTGTNTYTGGTVIAAGATIQIGDGTTVGSIVGDVADSGTLVYDHSDTVTPVGVISGTGDLTQAGSGLLVLNGVNTMSGLTTISAGTLQVGDASHTGAVLDSHIGGVTVGAAGTLEGHGTINGAVRNLPGGTVRPGGTIGTLTVGSYSQGPASTLAIEVSPTTASLLNSLGSASLNGTLALTFDPGPYSAHIYEIVAGAPVSGTFSTVTQSGLPSSFIYGVYYAPSHTQVDLVTEPTTVGQGFATVTTASLDQAQALAGMVADRQDDAGCSTDAKDQKAAGKSAACDGPSVWGQALAGRAHTNGDGDLGSADNTSGGFIGGVDARFGDGGSIGLALAYADNSLNLDSALMKSTGYAVFASLYGRESFGGFVFDAQGFYMDSHWTQTRTIVGYGNATSHPNGKTGGGVIQVSYPLMDGMVKPYLKVSYADFDRDATTETGAAVGPLALAVASGSNASTRAEAGVRLAATTVEGNGVVVSPELRVGVSQDLSSNTRSAQVALALVPTTTFTSYAVKPDQTAGVVAGAVRVKLSDTLDFYGDLRGRFSQNQSEGSLTLGGRYRF